MIDLAQMLSGDDRTNLFVAKLQGVANRNLLYLRNLWLNLFRLLLSAEGAPHGSPRNRPHHAIKL